MSLRFSCRVTDFDIDPENCFIGEKYKLTLIDVALILRSYNKKDEFWFSSLFKETDQKILYSECKLNASPLMKSKLRDFFHEKGCSNFK